MSNTPHLWATSNSTWIPLRNFDQQVNSMTCQPAPTKPSTVWKCISHTSITCCPNPSNPNHYHLSSRSWSAAPALQPRKRTARYSHRISPIHQTCLSYQAISAIGAPASAILTMSLILPSMSRMAARSASGKRQRIHRYFRVLREWTKPLCKLLRAGNMTNF